MIKCEEAVIQKVLGAAINVHKELGPGLLEKIYEQSLLIELLDSGVAAKAQVEIPVTYHGSHLGLGYKADIIVENSLVLELKTVDKLTDIHKAQLITYLKLLNIKSGFLLNFNSLLMKQGIKKISI